MPAIAAKEPVLDGRATLFAYQNAPETIYLRIYDPERRKYKSRQVEGVSTFDEARLKALDVFLDLSKDTSAPKRGAKTGSTKRRKRTISTELDVYLALSHEKAEKGLIEFCTHRHHWESAKVIKQYCEHEKLVYTTDIKITSFERYEIFRAHTSKRTRKRELKFLKEFLDFLGKHQNIDPYLIGQKDLVPRIKLLDEDFDANPPFRDSDLEIFWKETHKWVADGAKNNNPRTHQFRRMIWTFFATLRNSGMRPIEARRLKWSDLTFEDIGRFSSSKFDQAIGEMQAEGEPVEHLIELPDDHPDKFVLGREKRYVVHIRILDSKTGKRREVTCNAAKRLMEWRDWTKEYLKKLALKDATNRLNLTKDCFVFAIPQDNEWKVMQEYTYGAPFREIKRRLGSRLIGPEMTSRKQYTPYSFRSTRAVDFKRMGVDPLLAADQMGHTVDEMLKTYARLPVRERATKEAAHIDYGKTKSQGVIIDLFEEDG
jgi:integrase